MGKTLGRSFLAGADKAWHAFYVQFDDGSASHIFSDTYSGRADLAEYVKDAARHGRLRLQHHAAVEWYILWDDNPEHANELISGGTIVETALYLPRFYHCLDCDPAVCGIEDCEIRQGAVKRQARKGKSKSTDPKAAEEVDVDALRAEVAAEVAADISAAHDADRRALDDDDEYDYSPSDAIDRFHVECYGCE